MGKAIVGSVSICLLLGFSFILPVQNVNARIAGETPVSQSAPDRDDQLSAFVRRIFQDKSGNLWFGTNGDGVIRYDGKALKYFSINEGFGGYAVRGIVEDKEGNVWFGTDGGITKYDGKSFTNFTEADGLVSNSVWSIIVDSKGTIWIGTLQGVSRFDGKVFTTFDLPESEPDPTRGITSAKFVHSIMEDSTGKMWFGTNGGAYIYDPSASLRPGGKTLSNISEKDGLCSNAVNCILEDKDGNFWFATHHKGVCRWDGKSFTHFTSKDGVNGTEAWDLYKDSSGNIWFPIENSGVYRYDGKVFTNFQKEQGLTTNAIQCTFEDKEGRLWLGGWQGLFRYDGKSIFSVGKNGPWQEQNKTDPPKDSTDQLESDLPAFSATQFAEKIRPLLEQYCIECHEPGQMDFDFLTAETATDVAELRDVYAGVVETLEKGTMPPGDSDQPTDAERKLVTDWIKKSLDLKPEYFDRISEYVVETYEDKKGNLWFGTMHDGAARYDGKTLTWFSKKDGLPSNAVPSFAEDKDGNLWVGTQDGVCKFNGKTFTRFGIAEGLPARSRPSPMAWASVQADSKGNIWASMGRSIFRFDGSSFSEFKVPIDKEKITSYSIVAGRVSLQLEDKNGNLWFSTDGDGAYKFDGKSFTHFTKKDGLCSNNVTSILEDQQGNIWFTCIQSYQPKMTGDGGVCRYDGKSFTKFPEVKGLSENDIYTIYETKAGNIWIGASGVGAYRYDPSASLRPDGKTFTLFSETNRKHWTRNFGVQGITEDRNGTLWFGFSGGLFRFNGKSFFNVTKDGPWTDLVSAMAEAATGGEKETSWFHPDTKTALSALDEGNFDQAKTILLKLKRDEPNEPTIQEHKINEVGYRLVFGDQLDLAIEFFKLNTQLYPQAFNAFDSLAEAYLRSGNEQLAAKFYRKSLELNPQNTGASEALSTIAARKRFENVLVAPQGWLEEVLVVPPSFAPTMSLKGMEHLRLPPKFRDPDSDWFLSYLFAIELTEPTELNEKLIGDQLLIYFRGLASGGSDQNGKKIETDKFSIEPQKPETEKVDGEYTYTLTWQEPFANAIPLKQNIRVKVIPDKNKHGVVFVCGSPQPFGSEVWTELLKIRAAFE